MPILGTIASSRRVAVAAGVFDTIASTTLTSTASSITFSGIPQTYKHLEIHGWAYIPTGTGITDINIQFNGDTTSTTRNWWSWGFANDANIYTLANSSTGTSSIGYLPQDASAPGGIYVSIMDYTNTSKAKMARFFTGNSGANQPVLNRGSTLNPTTSAITSITFSSAAMGIGSTLTLYGLKDA
jgi:hypothetical protein